MSELIIPKEREFGWELKPDSSVYYGRVTNKSGQECVVLEHSLIRGITTEMLTWWFDYFPNLEVTLDDIPGYEGKKVSVYYLWHPSDHIAVWLRGELGPNNCSKVGAKLHIQEVMQAKKYGLKYKVDNAMEIFYHENDGWAMGIADAALGKMMTLRICYKDVYDGKDIIGVHYHYEVVIGTNKTGETAENMNKKIMESFSPSFWDAWLTHNAIEVGVFENFLPAIYEQRNDLTNLHYAKHMNSVTESPKKLRGFNQSLFDSRLKGYKESEDAFIFQGITEKSFL
ncbi:MAG: hypothetical protein AAF149_24950 [Bacteroidota bacterium]